MPFFLLLACSIASAAPSNDLALHSRHFDRAPLVQTIPPDSTTSSSLQHVTTSVGYRGQVFPDHQQAAWQLFVASVDIHHRLGTFGLAYRRFTRFDRWDDALVLEAYPNLWSDAYAHLRYQHTFAPEVYAKADMLAELFQPVEDGWVPFASARLRTYDEGPISTVYILGGGADKYLGDWLMRGRAQLVMVAEEPGSFFSLLTRRYLRTGTGPATGTYLEARAGYGDSDVITGVEPLMFDSGRTYSASLGGQWFFSSSWGASAAATLVNSAALPTRVGFSLRLMARW